MDSKISHTFNLVLRLLDVSVTEVAAKSGVSASQLTRFRKGERDLTLGSFTAVLRSLPKNAQDVLVEALEEGDLTDMEIASKILETTC